MGAGVGAGVPGVVALDGVVVDGVVVDGVVVDGVVVDGVGAGVGLLPADRLGDCAEVDDGAGVDCCARLEGVSRTLLL